MINNYSWDGYTSKIKVLAYIDESTSYEVDQAQIGYNPTLNKYVLMMASGCSCWSGDFNLEEFDTLDQLEEALLNRDWPYSPSLLGAKKIIAEARENDK